MNQPEIFFFDVDGTLLDNKTHKISESTLSCLAQLQQKGKKIVISSGRDVNTIMQMPQLAAIAWDGYVCRNGSVVANSQRQELYHFSFDSQTIEAMEQCSIATQIPLLFFGEEEWMTLPPDQNVISSCEFFHVRYNDVPIRLTKGQVKATMALAFDHSTSDYACFQQIPQLDILATPFCYADLVGHGIHKGVGIQKICDYFHVSLQDTMAFGDGINDLEMIQLAGIGVAMGQGRDEIKAIADYVTSSVDQDGIQQALKKYNILP